MIEFNGYISGESEKYYWKNSRRIGIKILICTLLLLLPPFITIARITQEWFILIGYCSLFVILPLAAFIPKSKKEQKLLLPKKIATDGEYIVSLSGKFEDSKNINDVKFVRDFGEFYELVFPMGKVSEKFICQKDLLVKGTIEEFEALFGDKIVRMN